MAACCKACREEIVSVKDGRRLSSGAVASVVCAVITNLLLEGCSNRTTADCHFFLAKEPAVFCRRCYVAKKYGELRKDLQLLRERLHISFDRDQVS